MRTAAVPSTAHIRAASLRARPLCEWRRYRARRISERHRSEHGPYANGNGAEHGPYQSSTAPSAAPMRTAAVPSTAHIRAAPLRTRALCAQQRCRARPISERHCSEHGRYANGSGAERGPYLSGTAFGTAAASTWGAGFPCDLPAFTCVLHALYLHFTCVSLALPTQGFPRFFCSPQLFTCVYLRSPASHLRFTCEIARTEALNPKP